MRSDHSNGRFRTVLLFFAIIAIAKIWLIAHEEIAPRFSPHDDMLYARLSEAWYWKMPYSATALIRAPVFPVWIALIRQTGLPHRLAAELLYLAAAGILAVVMRRIGMNRWVAGLTCGAIVFHPASIPQLNQLMREGFYTSVLLMGIAALSHGLHRLPRITRMSWLLMGLCYAILWHTRDESIILTGHMGMAILASGWICIQSGTRLKDLARRVIAIVILIILPILTVNLGIRSATRSVHGVAVIEELGSSSFTSAFNAILSVRPPVPIRHVPVTRATADMIAKHSPAFARLKARLDDGIAARWEKHYRPFAVVPGEVTGGGYMWALRGAARDAGFHASALKAASFYRRLADEITAAIDEGRLPSRPVPIGMIDPGIIHMGKHLPGALLNVLRDLFPEYDRAKEPETIPGQRVENTYKAYERAVLARPALWRLRFHSVGGWVYVPGTELITLNLLGPDGEIRATTSTFTRRRDLREEFGSHDAPRCGFSLDMPLDENLHRTQMEINTTGGSWTVPITRFLQRGLFHLTLEDGTNCRGGIDWIDEPFNNEPRRRVQNILWRFYTPFLLVVCGTILICILSSLIRRRRLPDLWLSITAIVCGMLTLRIMLITVIDMTWTQHAFRHFFPGAILFPVFLALLTQAFCTSGTIER